MDTIKQKVKNCKLANQNKGNFQDKFLLKVRTGARRNAIDGVLEIGDKKYLKISIIAVPKKGKANRMIIEFLAKEWDVPKQALEISSGKTSQYKVLKYKA